MVKASLAFGALLLSGAVLAAPESLMKVDTDKGEVLLEVQANGMAKTKISKVSTVCSLNVSGSTKAEAQQELKKQQEILRSLLRDEGISSAILDFSAPSRPGNEYDFPVANVAPMAVEAAMGTAEAVVDVIPMDKPPYQPRVYLNQNVGIATTSMVAMEKARALFNQARCQEDYLAIRRQNVELADPAAAQTAAKAQAITAAKAQAEGYAATLGMRVVRMIRISETGAIREFLGPETEALMQEMRRDRNRNQPVSDDVPVTVSISVDFALGPR